LPKRIHISSVAKKCSKLNQSATSLSGSAFDTQCSINQWKKAHCAPTRMSSNKQSVFLPTHKHKLTLMKCLLTITTSQLTFKLRNSMLTALFLVFSFYFAFYLHAWTKWAAPLVIQHLQLLDPD